MCVLLKLGRVLVVLFGSRIVDSLLDVGSLGRDEGGEAGTRHQVAVLVHTGTVVNLPSYFQFLNLRIDRFPVLK